MIFKLNEGNPAHFAPKVPLRALICGHKALEVLYGVLNRVALPPVCQYNAGSGSDMLPEQGGREKSYRVFAQLAGLAALLVGLLFKRPQLVEDFLLVGHFAYLPMRSNSW